MRASIASDWRLYGSPVPFCVQRQKRGITARGMVLPESTPFNPNCQTVTRQDMEQMGTAEIVSETKRSELLLLTASVP